jgi:long-chain acyl-CoA synthetase
MNVAVYTDLLRDSLLRNSERSCFHIKRNGVYLTYTYADFHRSLNCLVSALLKNGFSQGDSGVVIGANGPEWVIAYHAYFLAGGCTVPIDPSLPAEEIREIIRITHASFILCSEVFTSLFFNLKKEFSFIKKIIALESDANADGTAFGEFCASANAEADAFSGVFSPDDHIITIFTSGTTGKAKGVMLSQRNLTAPALHGVPRIKIGPFDTMLAVLPLHHVFGAAACIVAALYAGMDVVFVPVMKGPLILEALRDRHVTILPSVPKMIALFYDNIERTVHNKGWAAQGAFSVLKLLSQSLGPVLGRKFRKKLFSIVHANFGGKLNLIVSGGASIEKKYLLGFHRMGFDIVEGYGLTETFGPITLCPAAPLRHGSVGPILPDNEMKIHEPDTYGIGEVLFKGASVFKGYYRNEEQTQAVFDPEGWFHTGDLGRIDKHGYCYLSGRKKDVIVLDSGKNAYPDELEEFYLKSVLIEEIGVFSAPKDGREIIAALIVPAPIIRKSLDLSEASEMIKNEIDRISRNLPSYKKIADFAVVYDPLPRTSTKKLKKHELLALYGALRDPLGKTAPPRSRVSAADNALMSTPDYALLTKQILSLVNLERNRQIIPGHLLELDLGLDSLKRLELLCRLEEAFSIVLPEQFFLNTQTVEDLFVAVMERKTAAAGSADGVDGSSRSIRQRIFLSAENAAITRSSAKPGRLISETLPHLAFSLSTAIWRPAIIGRESLDAAGPAIFCANHESYLDILWLLYALPSAIRDATFTIGKYAYLRSPLLAPFVTKAFIPAGRGADIMQTISLSIAVLKKGDNLIIFPEGTRTRTGHMNHFKSGIGMLVRETDAMVIPVKIKGTYALWPAGKLPKFFGARKYRPSLTFGKRFSLQELIDRGMLSPGSTDEQIAQCIRAIIAEM